MSVAFQGAVLVAPGVASYIDDLSSSAAGVGTATAVAILGEAERGEGNLPVLFTDPATVRAYYGDASASKPLVWGIIRAMNAGSGRVYGVRVGATTSASASLKAAPPALGSGATFNVTTDSTGAVTAVALNSGGTKYLAGDVLNISDPGTATPTTYQKITVSTINSTTGAILTFSTSTTVGAGYTVSQSAQSSSTVLAIPVTRVGSDLISVTTKEWGSAANLWALGVADGTNKGKKLSLSIHDGRTYVVDNLSSTLMQIERIVPQSSPSGLVLNTTVSGGAITSATIGVSNGIYIRGNSYRPEDIVSVNKSNTTGGTATFRVLTVNSTGGVLTIELVNGGANYTASTSAATTFSGVSRTFKTKASLVKTGDTVALKLYEDIWPGGSSTNATLASARTDTELFPNITINLNGADGKDTIAKLAAAINQNFNPTSGFGWKATISPSITDTSISSLFIDNFSEKSINNSNDISSNLTLSPVQLTADTKAVADALNGSILGNFVSASILDVTQTIASNNVYVFSGGTNLPSGRTTPSVSDWADAITSLEALNDVDIICPMTSNATYQSMVLGHCLQMSSISGKKERIAVFGGPLGQTLAEAKALASTFNSKRAILVWPTIKDYDDYGNLLTWAPFYLASTIAGILQSQNDIAEPLTNKTIAVRGLLSNPRPSELDDIVQNGVFALKFESGRGHVVTQSLTTWTGDTKFARREISTVRATDKVVRSVREALSGLVGSKNTSKLQSTIGEIVNSALQNAESNGLIVAGPTGPAYKDIVIRTVGDAIFVDFSISPAIPANYILITAHVM